MRPLLNSRRRHVTLNETASATAAVAADFRRRIAPTIRAKMLRRAASVKARMRPHEDQEGDIARAIAKTPDLGAVFQHSHPHHHSHHSHPHQKSSHSESSSSLALATTSTLANSYGTLPTRKSSPTMQEDSPRGGGSGNASEQQSNNGKSNGGSNGSSKSNSNSSSSASSPKTIITNFNSIAPEMDADFSPRYSRHAELFEELTNPVGKYRRIWLGIVFLFVLFNAITIPFLLGFQSTWHRFNVIAGLLIFAYIGDLFFIADVILYFYTPFSRDGMYERNLKDIRNHYLKTWFVPDLLSSFPFDLLFLPFGIKHVLFARFTRFLRFSKNSTYFAVWEQYSTRYPQGIRFFKLMLGLMLILHWLGCFWFYCAYTRGFGDTIWLPDASFEHVDVTTQYVVAIWWSTNIITQVGGDPGLPTNNFERMSDFVVAFIAVFVVAMVIGNVTELVSELSADEGELRSKLTILNSFMYARRLPEELQERIRNYYHNLWSRRGINDGDTTILAELPSNLRTEVSLIMNQDILGKVPIFQSSSPGFINSLVLYLKPQTYLPRETIVKEGSVGKEMYFISRGQVNVVVQDKVVGRIGEGGFFGEVCALKEDALRTATIVAIQFVDTFVLHFDDLQGLFRVFPHERNGIMHVAETRRAKDLLRKTLADPYLLARESMVQSFEQHPFLVNLLIDLFQPLDMKALALRNLKANSLHPASTPKSGAGRRIGDVRLDENGEIIGVYAEGEEDDGFGEEYNDDEEMQEDAGVLFTPNEEASTIYFIGKGAIDIYAHSELEHTAAADTDKHNSTDDDTASDTTTENDGPQHVIRLTEGHFFGLIAAENYRVSAVVPIEHRAHVDSTGVATTTNADEAIIFALTSHDLPKLHDYYMTLPENDYDGGRSRQHMKRALVTWLQRHRTPLDYVKSMLSLALVAQSSEVIAEHEQDATDAEARQVRAGRNWKTLLQEIAKRRAQTMKSRPQTMTHHAHTHQPPHGMHYSQTPHHAHDRGTAPAGLFGKSVDHTHAAPSGSPPTGALSPHETTKPSLPHRASAPTSSFAIVTPPPTNTAAATASKLHEADSNDITPVLVVSPAEPRSAGGTVTSKPGHTRAKSATALPTTPTSSSAAAGTGSGGKKSPDKNVDLGDVAIAIHDAAETAAAAIATHSQSAEPSPRLTITTTTSPPSRHQAHLSAAAGSSSSSASSSSKKPVITVSPASESSPNISTEPYTQPNWMNQMHLGHSPLPPAAGGHTSTTAASSAGGVSIAHLGSPPLHPHVSPPHPQRSVSTVPPLPPSSLLIRPNMHRAVSVDVGMTPIPGGATSAMSSLGGSMSSLTATPLMSPLVRDHHRGGMSLASTSADVSELLAQADMYQMSTMGRAMSSMSALSTATPSPANIVAGASTAANLDWLTSPNSHTPLPLTQAGRTASAMTPTPSLLRTLNLHPKPDIRRLPSHPASSSARASLRSSMTNATPLLQQASSLLQAPMSARTRSSMSAASGGQPFSFLLSLPSQTSGTQTPADLHPMSPTLPNSRLSPRARGLSIDASSMSGMNANGPRDTSPGSQQRGSVSTPRGNRRVSASVPQQPPPTLLPPKRVEFLERALSSLSAEDLLLIANKANMLLYTRMQQMQHEQTAAVQHAVQMAHSATPPSMTPQPRF